MQWLGPGDMYHANNDVELSELLGETYQTESERNMKPNMNQILTL